MLIGKLVVRNFIQMLELIVHNSFKDKIKTYTRLLFYVHESIRCLIMSILDLDFVHSKL